MTFGRRILLLVPHPDDEVVGFCVTIGRAQATGSAIFALYLTHGCIPREEMWPWQRNAYETVVSIRHKEAQKAAQHLSINGLNWSPRPARKLWKELSDVHAEIAEAISVNTIDQLWVPAYEGGNPDHDGLNAAASLFRSQISVIEFAEYNYNEHREVSQNFPHRSGHETWIDFTTDEQTKKRAALNLYTSEKFNLGYVKTERECYRPLFNYDYTQPPHAGTLWYERFHWTPFRHPRIDFTLWPEVSHAIHAHIQAIESRLRIKSI
jgi:LmbE family N-acetylglucosaminyl deacetylase